MILKDAVVNTFLWPFNVISAAGWGLELFIPKEGRTRVEISKSSFDGIVTGINLLSGTVEISSRSRIPEKKSVAATRVVVSSYQPWGQPNS